MPKSKSKDTKLRDSSVSKVAPSGSSSVKAGKDIASSKSTTATPSTRQDNGLWAKIPSSDADPEAGLTAVFDITLLLLLIGCVASSWIRQFTPIHGGVWRAHVGTASTVLLSPSSIFFLIDLRDALDALPLSSGPFPHAAWFFLALALMQPIQFVLGDLLSPSAMIYAGSVLLAIFAWLLRVAILRTWIALDEYRKSPEWLLRVVNVSVYPGTAAILGIWGLYGRDPLSTFLIPQLPAEILPETWAVPLIVTGVAAGRSVLRFRAQRAVTQEKNARAVSGGRSSANRDGNDLLPLAAWAGLCVVPILHGLLLNTHSPLGFAREQLDARLKTHGFSLMDRADGAGTGYVSVLHNDNDGYKVMRCGHSLLGGVWDSDKVENPTAQVKEPIYAVFVMLEAGRLMMRKGGARKVERNAQALNIGLGIGTAPEAFMHHGINTTIIELDRNVYNFALAHFDLPPNHTAVIGDGIEWVSKASRPWLPPTKEIKSGDELSKYPPAKQWDYILHDVFTGGVEPAALFTFEFLNGLKRLLKDDGSIAINYAGDFSSPIPHIVVRTIFFVFGNNCQVFRETESDTDGLDKNLGDQTNVVVFCRKEDLATKPFVFARPEAKDYLGTWSRRNHLVPKHSMPTESFTTGSLELDRTKLDLDDKRTLLWNANVDKFETYQIESGRRHWELMREVIPADIWINY